MPLATPESQSHMALASALQEFAGFSFAGPSPDMIRAKKAVEAAAAAQPRPQDGATQATAAAPAAQAAMPAAAPNPQQVALWQQHAAMVHQQMFAAQQAQILAAQQQALLQQQQMAAHQRVPLAAAPTVGVITDDTEDVSLA